MQVNSMNVGGGTMFYLKSKKNNKISNLKRLLFSLIVIMVCLSLLNNITIGIENPITTFGNGSSEEIIIFPEGGGYNNELNLTIPEGAIITDANMELRGFGVLGVINQFLHNFTDTVNNTAWEGLTTENPPKSKPATFTTTNLTTTEYTNISASNNVRASYVCTGAVNYPYHLFRFNITETDISTLEVYWEGYGFFSGMMLVPYWSYLDIWNISSSSWLHIGTNSSFALLGDFIISSGKLSNPSDFIDSSNQLFLMAQGTGCVDKSFTSTVYTDYTKIETQGTSVFFPTSPTLNIGDDDDIEWELTGVFDQNVIIDDDDNFKSELQSIIDTAEPGCEFVDIPLNFSSTTQGKLKISNISISYEFPEVNLPPQLVTDIPNGTLGFFEDTDDGDNLINLNDYFWDDRDNGSLIFSILKNNNEIRAELDADGYHLDFSSDQDFFGVYEFQVRASDKGLDGVVSGDIDLFLDSNIFTVAVWPTNDAPVIDSVGSLVISDDDTELSLTGSDGATEDEWFNKTITTYDIDGDAVSFSCNLTLPQPSQIEIIPDLINDYSANLAIYATNDYVGMLSINISISDNNESGSSRTPDPSNGSLSDYINLIIEVHNTNDGPKLIPIEEIICSEDQWFNFTLNVTDDDLEFGDEFSFSTNLTTEINSLIPGKNYEFNEITGKVSMLPNNDMVGEYWTTFEVTDKEGAADSQNVKIIINNVNDAPSAVISWPLNEEKFNTTTLIYFDGTNSTDDDLIHDDRLKFQWSSNISGNLGTNQKFFKKIKDAGWHKITLTVTDYPRVAVQESILIEVTAVEVPDDVNGDGDGNGDPGSDKSDKKDGDKFDYTILILIVIILIIIILGFLIYIRHRKKSKAEEKDTTEGAGLPPTMPQPPFPPTYFPAYPLAQPFPLMQPQPIQPMVQPAYQQLPQPPAAQVMVQPEEQQLTQLPAAQIMVQPEEQQLAQPPAAEVIDEPKEQQLAQPQVSEETSEK